MGNMIISPDNTLSTIDFNRPDFGDPWEEFNRIVWSAAVSPRFAAGQLNGYVGGRPSIEFFQLLAFYISSNPLSSIYWAIPFGEDEITTMKKQARDALTWFDNYKQSHTDLVFRRDGKRKRRNSCVYLCLVQRKGLC